MKKVRYRNTFVCKVLSRSYTLLRQLALKLRAGRRALRHSHLAWVRLRVRVRARVRARARVRVRVGVRGRGRGRGSGGAEVHRNARRPCPCCDAAQR